MVVGVGAAAIVVAVVVHDDEHRVVRVGVVLLVLIHHLFILKRAEAAAGVFVAFVPGAGNGDDLGRTASIWVDVFDVVRLIRKRCAHFARRPQVVELHPSAARGSRVGIDLVGPVRRDEIRRRGVRVVGRGPIKMDVVHQRPLDSFGGQGRNHPLRKGRLWREEAHGVAGIRAPSILIHLLVELDLHAHVALVQQRHERVVVTECDQIEPRVAERSFFRLCLVVGGVPIVPRAAAHAGGFERVEVFDQRARERHLRTGVGQGGSGFIDRVFGPGRIGADALIENVVQVERVMTGGLGLGDALPRVVDRLVHVPEEADLDRLGGVRSRESSHRQRHRHSGSQLHG